MVRPKKIAWFVVKTVFSVVITAALIMLIYRLALDSYDFGYRIFSEDPVSPAPGVTMSVAIVEGKNVREIGEILQEKGLIRSATLFYITERFSSYHGMLQPGIYELCTDMTPEEMMAIMAEGYEEPEEEEVVSGNSEASDTEEITVEESEGTEETGETEDAVDIGVE